MIEMNRYRGLIYLLLLFVVVPLLAYRFAIRDSFSLWKSYRYESEQVALIEQNKSQDTIPEYTISSIEQIESGILLEKLLPQAEIQKVTIEKYTPFVTEKSVHAQLHTAEIVLKGEYIPIVKLIDHIEKQFVDCKVLSLNFKASVNRQTKRRQLNAILIIQQLNYEKN